MAGPVAFAESAPVDVRHTLKFIGRLAVRLNTNAEFPLSPEALEQAIQHAVSNLSEGVLKRTLESDPDRFGRALADRIASLQAAKEAKASEGAAAETSLEGIAETELVSDVGFEAAMGALVDRWGEERAGMWPEEEGARWRNLALQVMAARPVVPAGLAAAYVNVETALGRKRVVAKSGAYEGNMLGATSKVFLAETVASSVLLSSACLPPQNRLILFPPLMALLNDATKAVTSSGGENLTKVTKRLHKLVRSLLTNYCSLLKTSSAPPTDAFRTGASLAVALAVTRYLVLTNNQRQKLGDAGLTKLQQTVLQSQATLTAQERGALVRLLCTLEEGGGVRSLNIEGQNAVRGALYEGALRVVPFEGGDAPIGAWSGRIELARKAVALLRSQGNRTRANAILTSVLNHGSPSNLDAAAKPHMDRLRTVLPSESLLSDPGGLTTWLVNSASDDAFAIVRTALQSSNATVSPTADRVSEPGPQKDGPEDEEELLFYIDKKGSGIAPDPAEKGFVAAAEIIAQKGPLKTRKKTTVRGGRNGGVQGGGEESEESLSDGGDDLSDESGGEKSDREEIEEKGGKSAERFGGGKGRKKGGTN